jgi:hypothetical protein
MSTGLCFLVFSGLVTPPCSVSLTAMTITYVRPDAADMMLRVFQRTVHPELLEIVGETRLQVGGVTATLRICADGHAIEVRHGRAAISELAVSRLTPTPRHACAVERRLIGYRTHTVQCGRLQYNCSYQLETVAADVFLQLHRELEVDARKATLSISLPGAQKTSPRCLSFLSCDLLRNGIVVHSYHTFPGNGAILRVQSLFELVPAAAKKEAGPG